MPIIDKKDFNDPEKLNNFYKYINEVECPICHKKELIPIMFDFDKKEVLVNCYNCCNKNTIKMIQGNDEN